ncbi:hypothetical protein HYU07_03075, partial [Candidatus Woesearchaeota archaeon]|nr:hypothetical protein [Candidatus Woesearchaeota archaeon]
MRLEKQEVNYDVGALEDVALGAIADYVLHSIDPAHKTTLLKNTNFTGTMLLDGITSYLPAYSLLKCMPIKKEDVLFYFKDPLNTEAIVDLLHSADLHQKISLKALKTKRGSDITELYLDNTHALTIEDYAISLPYFNLAENGRLKEGLQAAIGLVTRIHQDALFRRDIRKVYFAQYQPIFKLIFPELFEDRMTDFLRKIQELVRTKKLHENPDFKETRLSKLNADYKKYAFDKNNLPEHLEYIVVCPDKQEAYIRFGSKFDYERIQKMLRPLNFSMSDDEKSLFKREKFIKKGGAYRKKSLRTSLKERKINDQYGSSLVALESGSIIKLYLSQDDATFERAAMIFCKIYYGRLFYTGLVPTSEISSDISKNERMFINSIDMLTKLYTTFLQVIEEKQR